MAQVHWHAFSYTGSRTPSDSDAKNPAQPVRPLTISQWFRKPKQMHKGAFADADRAYEWMEAELAEVYTDSERLASALNHFREHLGLGQDAYAGGYTRDLSGVYVRALLTCPRTGADRVPVNCPGAPQ